MENRKNELTGFLIKLRDDIDAIKIALSILPEILEHVNYIRSHLVSNKEVLTFKDTMEWLDISQNTLYRHISERGLPRYKAEGIDYFFVEDIKDWIKKHPNNKKIIEERKENTEKYRKRKLKK